ncbi:MAG: hypothetical protein GDA43_09530 [Hormoscilla sp. SP5CHS1]|nr:hypothetical protein [Hormoscilla sp. SP5CHS1]
MGISGIQIQVAEGADNLRLFVEMLTIDANFHTVTSLGIVRDADENAASKFQSVCDALRNANLPVPREQIRPTSDRPQVSVLILPDTTSPGTLETLCLRTVSEDPMMSCIEEYFDCVQQRVAKPPKSKDMDKAKVKVFLASREDPTLLLGQAAQRKYWNWDSPALSPVKEFIQAL